MYIYIYNFIFSTVKRSTHLYRKPVISEFLTSL